ncbi:MAG: Smr/MutS family protein [Patescibacteria group bacterium]|jgi:dsDNA-specific endonuclease/ATPase MutS2
MTSEIRKFAGEIRQGAPKLDLHGRDPHEIENQIDQFLHENYLKKELSVEIVYGIGRGVLSKVTRDFLKTHPLVEKAIDKGGSCIVILSE